MIGAVIVAVFTIALFAFLNFINENSRRKHKLASQFPGPPRLPIFGNSLEFFQRSNKEVQDLLLDWNKKYGKIYRVKIFDLNAFQVTDAKIIEIILSSNTKYLPKNRLYNFLKPWLGDGLLISQGKKWHYRRKIITPAFHFKILEKFVRVFDEQSQTLVQELATHNDGKVFDIHPYITLMALDVICEAAMGTKINAQTNTDNAYVKAVAEIANVISLRFAKVWQRFEILFHLFASKQKEKLDKTLKILHDFTTSIILKRREELLSGDNGNNSADSERKNEFGISIRESALLDILLKSTDANGIPLSNEDIREEVDTFMFEGHDTTTAGIIFTLYMISRHKDVQDKLFAEIRQVIGDDKHAPIAYKHLQDMKYIELVIKESFRFYPPVPGIGRRLDEDIHLEDGRIIPKDSNFNIAFFIMFKDPDYFDRPEIFDPERFRSGKVADLMSPYTFIPFSAGSRNCIGQKFAMLEIKSSVSKILRHYELLPLGEAPITSIELVMRTQNGVQMGLKTRTYT